LSKKKKLSIIDHAATVASFLYPLISIPQVIEVLSGNVGGVSFVSWAGYGIFSFVFLAYGMLHKITPMVITNTLWLMVDVFIIAGLIIYGGY